MKNYLFLHVALSVISALSLSVDSWAGSEDFGMQAYAFPEMNLTVPTTDQNLSELTEADLSSPLPLDIRKIIKAGDYQVLGRDPTQFSGPDCNRHIEFLSSKAFSVTSVGRCEMQGNTFVFTCDKDAAEIISCKSNLVLSLSGPEYLEWKETIVLLPDGNFIVNEATIVDRREKRKVETAKFVLIRK